MRRSIPWQEQMTTKISLSGESEHAGTRTEPGAAGQGAEEFYTISLFDLLIVIAERKRFYSRAIPEKWLVLFTHDHHTPFTHIVLNDKGKPVIASTNAL